MKSGSARDSALSALGLSPDTTTGLSCPPRKALAALCTGSAWNPRPSARCTAHAEEPRKNTLQTGGASRAINSRSPRPPPRPARAAPLPARGAPLAPGQAAPATQCGRSARARPSRRGLPPQCAGLRGRGRSCQPSAEAGPMPVTGPEAPRRTVAPSSGVARHLPAGQLAAVCGSMFCRGRRPLCRRDGA